MTANMECSAYWSTPFSLSDARDMAAKYVRLRTAIELQEPDQTEVLRRAAMRWPGCLREARRATRGDYAARESALQLHLAEESVRTMTRAQWADRGLGAIVLWRDLHALVSEVQRWRAARAAAEHRRDGAAFLAFVAQHSSSTWWPPQLDAAFEVTALGAERRLAQIAGMSVLTLRAALFMAH